MKQYRSKRIRKLEKHISKKLPENDHHGKEHVRRAFDYALRILGAERVSSEEGELTLAAILCHDLAREVTDKDHAAKSAEESAPLLNHCGFSKKEIKKVQEAIQESSRSGDRTRSCTTMISKIVFDADKLDGLGMVGVERTLALFKERAEKKEYRVERAARWLLERVTDALQVGLYTSAARELAQKPLADSIRWLEEILGEKEVARALEKISNESSRGLLLKTTG